VRTEGVDRRQFLAAAGAGALALAVDPRAFAARLGGFWIALVTADLESHVVVLDLGSLEPIRRIRTAPGPRSIEAAHGFTAIVGHSEHGVVTLIDADTTRIDAPGGSRIRAELDRFEEPRYTAAHPRLPLAYVTDSAAEEVAVVHTGRGRVLWRTRVPGQARHISIGSDGRTLWTVLGNASARVAVLDTSDARRPKLVRTISPPFLAHDVVFAPDGGAVWVTSGDERRVAIYRDSRRPARILEAGAPPQHVAFTGEKVFVASGDDGTVRRHRLDGDLVREVRVPFGSYNVTAGSGLVVTPSLGGGTVCQLDRHGRVRKTRKVARAAHDVCTVLGP
jgi:DNA-binding beta-propeller fold protein YncE